MKTVARILRTGLPGLAAAVVSLASARGTERGYLSPLAVAASPDGTRLYVAAATGRCVVEVECGSRAVSRKLALPADPAGLAPTADGTQLLVVAGGPAGQLHTLDLKSGKLTRSVVVGHTPVAVTLSSDGRAAFVCNRLSDDVSVVDLATGREVGRIGVGREPVAGVLAAHGRTLFVANLLPNDRADGEQVAARISVIDAAQAKVLREIALPNGSTSVRSLCLSPDGTQVYVTHGLARYQMPATQLDRGWVNTSALTVLDVAAQARVNTVLLDDVDLGAANPWGVACSSDGHWLVVAHAGTHELSVIDRPALLDRLRRVAGGESVSSASASAEEVPNDLSFLVGIRRRVPLAGLGPRGLVIVGPRAYATEYFTDSLGVADLEAASAAQPQSIPLGPSAPSDQTRQGERLFHDATICFQHWLSCASCHPEGRVDGLNWDLLNDGLGNPKNTKSMLLAHRTPPAMSLGVRETAETAVRAGIRHILFAVRPEAEAVAIDTYLKSLRPVVSPHRDDGRLNPAAKRGERVFAKAGCAVCHPAPLFTDLKAYNVGTGTGREVNEAFDTPTLIEAWRTGPYLHDGRAATIRELLRQFNPEDRHGSTARLTNAEVDDLAEYVLSL